MATIDRFEKLFLRALRTVLPQYRVATDDFLVQKLEKRLKPATEEVICLLESAGCSEALKKDVYAEALITKVLQLLAHMMKNNMHTTVTIKTLLDCISLIGPAVDQQYPHAIQWEMLPYEILPNYSKRAQLSYR
jgi:hypothetical protein